MSTTMKNGDDKPLNWKPHSTVTTGSVAANISFAENADGARMYSMCLQRIGRAGATRYFRLGDLDALIETVMEVRLRFSENAQKAEEQRETQRAEARRARG